MSTEIERRVLRPVQAFCRLSEAEDKALRDWAQSQDCTPSEAMRHAIRKLAGFDALLKRAELSLRAGRR